LHAGCTHMRKAFDIEDINLEVLIATALDDPQAVGENKVFRGINFSDLQMAYREFCKNEKVVVLTVDRGDTSAPALPPRICARRDPDCVAGVVRLELEYPCASHVFEMS
jgi:hypothetical protein